MNDGNHESQALVLGQKYAYATISLILGIACFVNLAGLEKAVLAVIFSWLALKSTPAPKLKSRRLWAQAGFVSSVSRVCLPGNKVHDNFAWLVEA